MPEGTPVKKYGCPVKRYVQTMDLKDEPTLIARYRRAHSREEAWQEIRLVMIVEAPDDFQWDDAMARLATLPRQAEWEEFVAQFQRCEANATSDEKWQMMERIFHLYE